MRSHRLARGVVLGALLASASSCSDFPMRPQPLVPLTGVVRDKDGTAIGFAYLRFLRAEDRGRYSQYGLPPDLKPPLGGFVRCDPYGSFSVGLYAGRYDVLIEPDYHLGYGAAQLQNVEISRDHPRLDYTFTGFWVRGHVYGPQHQLLDAAEIGAFGEQDTGYGYRMATVNYGTYSMLLDPGTWSFLVRSTSTAGLPSQEKRLVSVRADTTIDFTLGGEKVSGTVTGPGGGAMAGAAIYAYGTASASIRSDSTGAFVFYLPDGPYTFTVAAPPGQGYIASRDAFAVVAGPTTLVLSLAGVTWTGVVRYEATGTPIGRAAIYLSSVAGTHSSASAAADSAGDFKFIVAPQTVYQARVYPPQYPGPAYIAGYFGAGSDSTFDLLVPPQAGGAPVIPRGSSGPTPRPALAPRP